MDKEKKQILYFGYGLSIILAFIGVRLWLKHKTIVPVSIFLLGALAFLIITRVRWQALKLFYAKWMRVAHFIGNIVTTVIFSGIFYLVFGVVGIVLRLLRKDLLDQKIEPQRKTYWIKRERVVFDKKRYTQQF